ncbi:MAG: hypothetical protein GKR92_13195 [Gammaproteobacteria bacterium]|nr:MAG: hypothetical protein GKR92_13195 [Gammaproteobacteria bacterium]
MRSLARFILSGPMQAIAVVFGLAVLSLPFPFLIIFSGAALVLVTLQLGLIQSVKVMLISAALIIASTYFLLKGFSIGPLFVWLSAVVVAAVYRNTQSISLSLQLLTVLGLFSVLLLAVMFPDMQMHWQNFMQSAIKVMEKDPALQGMWQSDKLSPERLEKYLPYIASLMTGVLVSLFILVTSITVFLGRQWQGFQENIRSFREEFVAIRLGKVLAGLAVVFLIAALVFKYAILWQLALVCLSIFSLQGMAIAHAFFGQFSNSIFGFVAVYGLLFIAAPQMIMTLSTLGVVDTFFDFRKRLVKR